MHHVTVPVSKHLELDVAGPSQEFLDVDSAVTKSGFGFGAGLLEKALELGGVVRHAFFDSRVKLFGIGSIVEEKMLENYKRSFDAAARFTRGYLERNGLLGV